MNTPLASIKAGSEAILFLLNRIMETQIEYPISKQDLVFILPRIHPIGNIENNGRKKYAETYTRNRIEIKCYRKII